MISYAIEPKSRGDEEKISTALHRLQEEDPTISYTRDPQTNELLLAGQGQSHIEVTVAKLKRRFGVEVNLKLPRIPYRETITAATEAHGRHKKQTGGHGQFGDCKVKFEPLPRGSDFEFVDDIFGGSIPRQFIPAVEKGHPGRAAARLPRRLSDGRLPGDASSTARTTRSTRTSCRSRWPARWRSRTAMSRARPTLLEPIMNVEVYAPSDYAGDLMGDLNGRRGRIGGMDTRGAIDGHPREGADVGDADLRAAPHVSDRRPRLVPHGVLALRGGAVAPARRRSSPPPRPSAEHEVRRKSDVGQAECRNKKTAANAETFGFNNSRIALCSFCPMHSALGILH